MSELSERPMYELSERIYQLLAKRRYPHQLLDEELKLFKELKALEKELGQYKRSDKVLKGGIEWRYNQLQKLREGIDKRYQDIKEAFEREGEANEWVDGRWNLIREIDELLKQ